MTNIQTDEKGQVVRIDLSGKRFGTVVLGKDFVKAPNGGTKWPYTCDCGYMGISWAETFKRQPNFTCPECRKKVIAAKRTTHGYKYTPMYRIWGSMRSRCNNPNHSSYKDYGGRGIKVCERWNDFKNFLDDMGERPSPDHQLERKDNSLGYSKDNCVWATVVEQSNNRRSNHTITFNEETHTLSEWGRIIGKSKDTIRKRLIRGLPIEKVLSKDSL